MQQIIPLYTLISCVRINIINILIRAYAIYIYIFTHIRHFQTNPPHLTHYFHLLKMKNIHHKLYVKAFVRISFFLKSVCKFNKNFFKDEHRKKLFFTLCLRSTRTKIKHIKSKLRCGEATDVIY